MEISPEKSETAVFLRQDVKSSRKTKVYEK